MSPLIALTLTAEAPRTPAEVAQLGEALGTISGVIAEARPGLEAAAGLPAAPWHGALGEEGLRLCDPQGRCETLPARQPADTPALVAAVAGGMSRVQGEDVLEQADAAAAALAMGDCALAWARWKGLPPDPRWALPSAQAAQCAGQSAAALAILSTIPWAMGEPAVLRLKIALAGEGPALEGLLLDLQALTDDPAPLQRRIQLAIDDADYGAALALIPELARRGAGIEAELLRYALEVQRRPDRQPTLAHLTQALADLEAALADAEAVVVAVARTQNALAPQLSARCQAAAPLLAQTQALLAAAPSIVGALSPQVAALRQLARAPSIEPLLTPRWKRRLAGPIQRAAAAAASLQTAVLWQEAVAGAPCTPPLRPGPGLPGASGERVAVLSVGEGVICPGGLPAGGLQLTDGLACYSPRLCDCALAPVLPAAVLGPR